MFEWAFSEFLERRSPYAFKSRLGVSEKTVYSWVYPNHTPHGRKDPITRAVEVLDVIFEFEPSIGYDVLAEIANRYGYKLEKLTAEDQEIGLAELMKEAHDVLEAEAEAREDGRITPEEAERIYKEIKELEFVLAKRKARLKELLEKVRR